MAKSGSGSEFIDNFCDEVREGGPLSPLEVSGPASDGVGDKLEKPPLGVMPKSLWMENRFYDIVVAIGSRGDYLRNSRLGLDRVMFGLVKELFFLADNIKKDGRKK
jgi:hypothetical protein